MSNIDKLFSDGTFSNLSKREVLQITRQRAKLEKNLGSISDLTRLPAALFVIDVQKEYIAVREAKRLNIPVFAMVDTCCDPTLIDFVIPANDDASKSISLIVDIMAKAIQEGLDERKADKDSDKDSQPKEKKVEGGKMRARKVAPKKDDETAQDEPAQADEAAQEIAE
jgi:small subunit ribosomal protein S2